MANTNYRKIWIDHFGPIPKDDEGRSYEIHHIDKNRNNNDISNLICLSIEEHYNIHHNQGDWGACYKIGQKMKLSSDELRELNSKAQKKRVKDGTHHWLNSNTQRENQLKRVKDGTHHLLSGEIQKIANKNRLNAGTHNWLDGESAYKREKQKVLDGTHIFLNGKLQSETHRKKLQDGTSHLLKNSQCPHCNKIGRYAPMKRWHFDNCKLAPVQGFEP